MPPQYGRLQGRPPAALRRRLLLLHRYSDLVYASWRLLPLTQQVSRSYGLVRHVRQVSQQISPSVSQSEVPAIPTTAVCSRALQPTSVLGNCFEHLLTVGIRVLDECVK